MNLINSIVRIITVAPQNQNLSNTPASQQIPIPRFKPHKLSYDNSYSVSKRSKDFLRPNNSEKQTDTTKQRETNSYANTLKKEQRKRKQQEIYSLELAEKSGINLRVELVHIVQKAVSEVEVE